MTYAHRQPCTCSACGQHDPVIQPELDLQADFVGDIDDDAPWPMPPGGPVRWPSPAAYTAPAPVPQPTGRLASTGSAIAGALLGMVRS